MKNISGKIDLQYPPPPLTPDSADRFDGLASPVMILDRKATVMSLNQAACNLAGGNGEEVLGQPLWVLRPRRLWEQVLEQVGLAQSLGQPMVCEVADHKSATVWEFTISALPEKGGGHIVLMARDVTAAKRDAEAGDHERCYLEAVQETAIGLMSRVRMDVLLEAIISRACTVLDAQSGHVYLVEPTGADMKLCAAAGELSADLRLSVQPYEGLYGKIWQTGQPLVVNETASQGERNCPPESEPGRCLQATVGVPLISDSCVIGVIGVATTEAGRVFQTEDIETLNRFAQLASIAIDNAQMYKTLQQESVERQRAEEARRDSIEKYKLLFESNPFPVLVYDKETLAFVAVNQEATRHYGYSREEFLAMKFSDIRYKGDTGALLLKLSQSASDLTRGSTWKHRRKDGTVIDVEVTPHEILFEDREAVLALISDITERKRAEDILQKKEEHYRSLIENASDLILIVSGHGTVGYISPSVERALGYEAEELICRNIFEFVHPEDFSAAFAALSRTVELQGQSQVTELRLRHKLGQWRFYESIGKCVLDENSEPNVIVNARDITERKAAEEQLVYNAFHDPLTDLPNRRLFMDRLGQAIRRAKRREGHLYAVLFLDFDQFKLVNDSLGHIVGDELLIAISKTLVASLRPEDTIARLGGDEFAILIEDLEEEDAILRVAEKIQKLLAHPFELSGQLLYVTVSIGIALGTTNYDKPDEILRDADTAMYRAKALGKSCHAIFDSTMHTHAVQLLERRNDLRQALERDEFVLYYQPIMQLEPAGLAGFEALARWRHPKYGLLPPAQFIPLVEEMNLIGALGEWVLREACHQLREWDTRYPDNPPIFMSVNLSVKQLAQPDLVEQVRRILQETGLPAHRLKLEITESLFMEDPEAMAAVLNQFRQLGVQLQIDDFGTGYSSLSYLHTFPVDTLKIDRSFVYNMNTNPKNAEIVRTIIMLAHNLGMTVIAEGIETQEHLSHLKELECELGQGYFFSQPVESRAAEKLLIAGCEVNDYSCVADNQLPYGGGEPNFNSLW